MEYASKAVGNAGLATGIIGTALGAMANGSGLLNGWNNNNNFGCHNGYVTKAELDYVHEIARKDSEIALLRSEQNTENKIADVYERLITRINADYRAQSEINSAQAVYNASANSAIAVLQNQVGVLNSLTKTVVPADNICPKPMPLLNSWTAPTTAAAPTTT